MGQRTDVSQRATPGANTLDTRGLTPGAYTMRILNENGSVQHARFVKR